MLPDYIASGKSTFAHLNWITVISQSKLPVMYAAIFSSPEKKVKTDLQKMKKPHNVQIEGWYIGFSRKGSQCARSVKIVMRPNQIVKKIN